MTINEQNTQQNQDYEQLIKDVQAISSYADTSMKEAYEYYIRNDKDIVKAIIDLEDRDRGRSIYERVMVSSEELFDFVRTTVAKGNISRIIIKHGNKVCLTIPVTLGAVGVVMFPYISIMAILALMFGQYEVIIERYESDDNSQQAPQSIRKLKFATVDKI